MWKPRVLRSRFAAGLGGNSARFAGEILARRAPTPDSGLYPEAWLVFREEEEREAVQAAGEMRLTQITLRLALQLSEYFTAPTREERTVMEVASLRRTLRTCLTALETRDRETCREVRTLMALSREEKREEPPAPAAVRERETVRERLVERLAALERMERRTEERTAFSKTVLVPGTGERRAEQKTEHRHGERQGLPRERTRAASAAFLWRRTASHAPGAMTVSGRAVTLQTKRAETALLEHKKRFLQIFSRVDTREQAMLWRTVEEQMLLTTERRRQWTEEYHLTAQEKLERLVRESTLREYRSLLQVLERQVRAGSALPAEFSEKVVPARESTDEITAPVRRETGARAEEITPLAREAAPLIDWLSRTIQQGRIQRKAMLLQMEAAPESAQRAFLALARESGAFHVIKKGEQPPGTVAPPPMERLTLLTRESRRQELETLVRWTRARVEWEAHMASVPPEKAKQEPAAPPLRRESAAAAELRQFLLRERETDRALTRILAEIRPGEREVLYESLRELTGGAPAREKTTAPAGGEIIRLLERTGDPAALLERVWTTETFRTAEIARLRERTVLERLRTFSQHREEVREKETERLVQGLDREERIVLLKHLQTIREIPQSSRQSGAEQAQPDRLLEQVLIFATRKEYNTFHQQLTQYLQRQTEPSRPILATVLRWTEDRRRWEGLEKAALPPAAVERVLRLQRRETVTALTERRETALSHSTIQIRTSPAYRPPVIVPARPTAARGTAVPAYPVQRTAEAMAPVWRQPKQQGEQPGGATVLPAHRAEARDVLLQATIKERDTQKETQFLRETVLRQSGEVPSLPTAPAERGETHPLTLRQDTAAPRRKPRTLVQPRSAGVLLPPRERATAVTWRRAEGASIPDKGSGPTQPPAPPAIRYRTAPAEEIRETERPAAARAVSSQEELPGAEPLVVRHRTEVLTEEETVQSETIWRDIALLTRVRLEKRPVEIGRRPGPISVSAPMERPLGKRTLSLLRQREEQPAQMEGRESQAQQVLPAARRTEQPSAPVRRRAPTARPAERPVEPPELELRRDRTPEMARRQAEQAVEERVELAIERQAPQLRLLRRQSQEQERALEQQRNDLSGIKERLERQEAQVRQAVAQARIPAAEEPAQVRRLAKAVMKELEGQLRLERQRRGLS